MDLGFRGEVADLYHRYRRGYPPAAVDAVVAAFGLTGEDVVIDLGCGTGQLALPIADRVRAVLGIDPEPDMLLRASRARSAANVSWLIGSDEGMPAVAALLGPRSVGAVTIGQALHWMDHATLFQTLRPMLRPGGGVAVLANGTPLWLQDTPWSRALRTFMEEWLDTELVRTCGTDEQSRRRYADSLAAAGYTVGTAHVDYVGELNLDQVIGGVWSALPVDRLPPRERRPDFTEQVRRRLGHGPFAENVRVELLFGRV